MSSIGLLLLFPLLSWGQPELGPPPRVVPEGPKEHQWPKELVPALVQSLKDNDLDVRQYARSALLKLGPNSIPALIQATKSPDPELRRMAVALLGELAADDAMPALISALADKDAEVRRTAAFALSQMVGDR